MTPERLSAILAAYGARSDRWPESERAAALTLIAAQPALATAVAVETRLDALLDGESVGSPDSALVGRILASAPRRCAAIHWWAGFGFATAGLAGMLAGAVMVPLAAPHFLDRERASWLEDQPTLFTPVEGEEVPS